MTKQDVTAPESQEIEILPRQMWYLADCKKETLPLSKILSEMGLSGPRIPAEQLIDRSFVILRAKPFQSSFNEQAHAWFCVCKDALTNETFTTVLGGTACVDVIDALAAAGMTNPLEVTLRQVSGGHYGRYYVLE